MSLSGNQVLVSVIIPTFNAPQRLGLLLKSLENQSVRDFEVIVVDDGSTDTTREAVAALIEGYSVSLRYYYLDNTDIFGAGIARNHGAKQAKGDILLFLDQDCVAAGNLVQKHIEHHRTKDVILGYYAGYGDEQRCYDFSKLEDCIQRKAPVPVIKEFRDRLFAHASSNEAWKCFVSAHFSIKKKIFGDTYFDEAFLQWGCEDIELGYRLVQSGNIVHFLKDCVAYNSSSEPPRTKEKFFSLSKSLVDMYRKHPAEDMKLYCFERFYHTPLKYRGSLQLIFEGGEFELRELKTDILIDGGLRAWIVMGEDFPGVKSTIENIIPLIKSVAFDVRFVKNLKEPILSEFRGHFHRLIKILRDHKAEINLGDIRKQSFLMGTRFVGPRELSIDFHNKCNVRCLFCVNHGPVVNQKTHLPLSLDLLAIQKVLNQAYEMGVEKIRVVSEGEPLLSPDALPLLHRIAEKGFELDLLTNGTLLQKEHLIPLSKISKLGILMNFSAATKATYQKIYGGHPDNYNFVLRSLSLLSKLRQVKKRCNEAVSIHTTYIITKLNYHEIVEYIPLIKKAEVDYVYFKLAITYEGSEGLAVDQIEVRTFKKELLKAIVVASRCSLSTNLREIFNNMSSKGYQVNRKDNELNIPLPTDKCYNGWFFGRVNASGKYFICCRETLSFGNVRENNFKEVFFSSQMNDILKEGTTGIALDKEMWRKCHYCYHLPTNKMAAQWLNEK